jgi:hypothetical protein
MGVMSGWGASQAYDEGSIPFTRSIYRAGVDSSIRTAAAIARRRWERAPDQAVELGIQ